MAPRDIRPGTQLVQIPGLPAAQLYSHAASIDGSNRLVFTAGHWGMRNGQFATSLKQQVQDSFLNLEEALRAAGATPQSIVKLTFYVVGWPWSETDALVEPWLKSLVGHKPPSVLIPVAKLARPEAKFEVEAIAAVGGMSHPREYPLQNPTQEKHVDVVVVGAGFSGTQAAHDVCKAGLTVALLEATHRVGGRSKTIKLASGPGVVELGATWINQHTQPKIYATAKRLGLHPMQQNLDGDGILQTLDGKIYKFGSVDKVGGSPGVRKKDKKKGEETLLTF